MNSVFAEHPQKKHGIFLGKCMSHAYCDCSTAPRALAPWDNNKSIEVLTSKFAGLLQFSALVVPLNCQIIIKMISNSFTRTSWLVDQTWSNAELRLRHWAKGTRNRPTSVHHGRSGSTGRTCPHGHITVFYHINERKMSNHVQTGHLNLNFNSAATASHLPLPVAPVRTIGMLGGSSLRNGFVSEVYMKFTNPNIIQQPNPHLFNPRINM